MTTHGLVTVTPTARSTVIAAPITKQSVQLASPAKTNVINMTKMHRVSVIVIAIPKVTAVRITKSFALAALVYRTA
jgi:hypothetical protein